ncbi:TPA: hypothetical protein ACG1RS_004893 [Escherichia coli]
MQFELLQEVRAMHRLLSQHLQYHQAERKFWFVKNDYLQRMKRWDNDVQLLGTEIPKITWEKIERSLTDVEDEKTLLVPFKAEGPEGKRMYYGMYHCEEGYVEYAND